MNAVKNVLNYKNCLFFEEGIKSGGVGEKFGFMLYQRGFDGKYHLTAIRGLCALRTKCASQTAA